MKEVNLDKDLSGSRKQPVRLEWVRYEPNFRFNVVVIGDSAVGKSHLICRFVNDDYNDLSYPITRDPAFIIRTVTLYGQVIRLNICHPKGNERDGEFTAKQISQADGIVVVYDIGNQESFANVQKHWVPEIQKNAKKDVKVILVGSKLDLYDADETLTNRKIDFQTAQCYANEKQWRFFEASAKHNINVDDFFLTLTRCMSAVPFLYNGKIMDFLDMYNQFQPQPPKDLSLALAMMLQGDLPFEDKRKTWALILMLLRGVPDCLTLQYFALQELFSRVKMFSGSQSLIGLLGIDRIITLNEPPIPASEQDATTKETETCAFYEELAISGENLPFYKVPKGESPPRGDIERRFEARKLDLLDSLKSQYTRKAITERAIKCYLSLPAIDSEASVENTEITDALSSIVDDFKDSLLHCVSEKSDEETLLSINTIISAASTLVNKLQIETVEDALFKFREQISHQQPFSSVHSAALSFVEAVEECYSQCIRGSKTSCSRNS